MTAQTRSEIAALLERYGLAPIHRLGQHFLADANITRKIAGLADLGPGSKVVEVGAGTGTLTRALADTGASVVAYEIDGGLQPLLHDVTAGLPVELRFDDVMDVDFDEALDGTGWKMVANLPYNVGTPVLLEALQNAPAIELFVVMVQVEVARRLAASPGTPDYGLPSVIVGIHGDAKVEFTVPPQVFYPAPGVGSAVVVIRRTLSPEHASRAVELARAGFGQRRKMLRGSLAGVIPDPGAALEAAGIAPTRRAEDVTPDEYLRLAAVS